MAIPIVEVVFVRQFLSMIMFARRCSGRDRELIRHSSGLKLHLGARFRHLLDGLRPHRHADDPLADVTAIQNGGGPIVTALGALILR